MTCRAFLAAALSVSLVLPLAGCDRFAPSKAGAAQASPVAAAPLASDAGAAPARAEAKKRKAKVGGTDVTFLVVSDTHFGFGAIENEHDVLVPKLDAIEAHPYPREVGGAVGKPRGLLVTGDLTEWGKVEEWEPFVARYGLTGREGKLHMPVFEVIGNHDKVHGPWVEQQVAARHGGGRFYAWDWDDVHFVALGEAPDDEGLAFLARDLDGLEPTVPLVLYFHLALEGPWSTGHWFGEGDYKARLSKLLEGRFVAAVFHGHHHATQHYVWQGIDVFKPGAVKNGAHTFAVVHVTDDRFTLASYDWDRDVWAGSFVKKMGR